jgi:hypothetical protein
MGPRQKSGRERERREGGGEAVLEAAGERREPAPVDGPRRRGRARSQASRPRAPPTGAASRLVVDSVPAAPAGHGGQKPVWASHVAGEVQVTPVQGATPARTGTNALVDAPIALTPLPSS